jgi:uncharacterized protein (TIGR02231 family)
LKQPFQDALEKTMSPIFKTTAFLITTATALSPLAAIADRFEARSTVEAATLYPQGAEVTRNATISLPAGTHELVFFDIPAAHQGAQPEGLQTKVNGADLGPISIRTVKSTEAERLTTDAAVDVQATIEELENELATARQAVQRIALEGTAAEDALRFINGLSAPEGASAEDIIAFAGAIRSQSLEARLTIQDVALRIKDARKAMEDSTRALAEAKTTLQKLITTTEYRNKITLEVNVAKAGEVEVDFTYLEQNAGWTPQYQAQVDTVEKSLTLKRTMAAVQLTGEPWVDVALSFATQQPSRRTAPSYVSEFIRRLTDPVQVRQMKSERMEADLSVMDAPMMSMSQAAPAEVRSAAPTHYGLNLTYEYATPATLYSSNAGVTEFALEPLSLTPDLYVRAVPLFDAAGYLVADITNDSGEVILPGAVKLFRDGALLGETHIQTQVDGSEFELSFGAIDGIRVARVILDRNEGDRGFISKSNESASEVRLEVENLTPRVWAVELLDRVSVSEQEDLQVEWTALPAPDEENVDDKRGVLAWRFDLKAGDQKDVRLEEALEWPENQVLR